MEETQWKDYQSVFTNAKVSLLLFVFLCRGSRTR